jgi:hypothetical protein
MFFTSRSGALAFGIRQVEYTPGSLMLAAKSADSQSRGNGSMSSDPIIIIILDCWLCDFS